MTIVSLKTETVTDRKSQNPSKDFDLNRVELSDGSLFSFRICYLPDEIRSNAVTQGCEITAAQEEGFRFASACFSAEKAALRLIARAEQCTAGLTVKLKRRRHDASCVNSVIERLTGLNLINDRRFARLWIESRLRFSRSPKRLLSSLYARGIDRDDAQSALNAVLNEETELAMLVRYAKRHLLRAGKKSKEAYSFKYLLKNEGFSQQVINKFLDIE